MQIPLVNSRFRERGLLEVSYLELHHRRLYFQFRSCLSVGPSLYSSPSFHHFSLSLHLPFAVGPIFFACFFVSMNERCFSFAMPIAWRCTSCLLCISFITIAREGTSSFTHSWPTTSANDSRSDWLNENKVESSCFTSALS